MKRVSVFVFDNIFINFVFMHKSQNLFFHFHVGQIPYQLGARIHPKF